MKKYFILIFLLTIIITTIGFIKKEKVINISYIPNSYSDITVDNLKEVYNKKFACITFDDGPDPNKTKYLLKELEKRNVHVSFFMVGNRLLNNKYLIKDIYNSGHTIGTHTYNHKNLHNLDKDNVLFEINETNNLLESITGTKPTYLRPPYGTYNNYVLESNMIIILWSIDTEDWLHKDPNKIKDTIVSNIQDGDIILLHDLYDTSIEGALLAIDELQDEYNFVSIDELIKIKGINTKPNEIYYNFR